MRIRIIKWTVGIVFLAAMYIIGNSVITKVHEHSKKEDNELLKKYKSELQAQLQVIKKQEEFFELSDKELAEVDKKKQPMIQSANNIEEEMKKQSIKPDKLPAKTKEAYDWYISQRNLLNKLISDREQEVKKTYKNYKDNVFSYNEKVKRANNIAEKVGSTLIFLPIQTKKAPLE